MSEVNKEVEETSTEKQEFVVPEFKNSIEDREHAALVLNALAQIASASYRVPKYAGKGKDIHVSGSVELGVYDENDMGYIRAIANRYLRLLM